MGTTASQAYFYLIKKFFMNCGTGLSRSIFEEFEKELEALFFNEVSMSLLNEKVDFNEAFVSRMKEITCEGKKTQKIVVMPAGNFAVNLAKSLESETEKVIAYLDNFKTGATPDNKPILHPIDISRLTYDKVILATPSYVAQRSMKAQLIKLNVPPERIILTADIALTPKMADMEDVSKKQGQKIASEIEASQKACRSKIIFAATGFPQHYLHTIRALRKKGCWVGLLTLSPDIIYGARLSNYRSEFDFIHTTDHNLLTFFDILLKINADYLYTFDFFMHNHLAFLIRDIWRGKMFMEVYDMSDNVDFPKSFLKTRLEQETGLNLIALDDLSRKNAYQLVDGIIYRDSPHLMERARRAYKVNTKALRFLPFPERYDKLKDLDGCDHIVFPGHIPPIPDELVYTVLELARELAAQKIHMHFYNPSDPQSTLLTGFIETAHNNPCIHYHKPISIDDLNYVMRKYNWGWLVYDFKHCTKDQMDRNEHTFTSRLLSYVNAGLPSICSEENTYQADIIRKYNIGIVIKRIEVPDIGAILKKVDYPALCRNVEALRQNWDIHERVDDLLQFFESTR